MTETGRHTLVLVGQPGAACSLLIAAVDGREIQTARYLAADVTMASATLLKHVEQQKS